MHANLDFRAGALLIANAKKEPLLPFEGTKATPAVPPCFTGLAGALLACNAGWRSAYGDE